MEFTIDKYGFERQKLLTSPDDVRERLWEILGDKILRFNPYSVDDETLLACSQRATWQPFPALTQMVVFHFKYVREITWKHPYKAIFLHIGNDPAEIQIPYSMLTEHMTYTANRSQLHITANGHPITNEKSVEKLCGKEYFISHALPAEKTPGNHVPVYRMHRLKGSIETRATIIRQAMIASKITMLEEILKHPYCRDYLNCYRDMIDYSSPIKQAIEAIKAFPLYSNNR